MLKLSTAYKQKLYELSAELAKKHTSSADAPDEPWIFSYLAEEDEDAEKFILKHSFIDESAMSGNWLYKIMETFNLNKYGRGYPGYHKGDVWVMIDLFYKDRHYMYIYNDRNVCIGTCLITRDKDKKQHYDWNKPWFPGQRSSSYYDDSHWD